MDPFLIFSSPGLGNKALNAYFVMKEKFTNGLTIIFMVLLAGCGLQDKLHKSFVITETEETKIYAAKPFRNVNPKNIGGDTLVLDVAGNRYRILPSAKLRVNAERIVQIKTDDVIERAYLYAGPDNLYLFFTAREFHAATSWVQQINRNDWTTGYKTIIKGFNLGRPFIQNQKAYVNAFGFVGRIDLSTGKYDWKKENLYNRKKDQFGSFDTVKVQQDKVAFLKEDYPEKDPDKIVVDKQTGKIIDRN